MEAALFYQFLSQELTHKELLYFLLLRNLAERELAIMLTKLPSNQDVRTIKITRAKCFKIAKLYFSNVMIVSNNNDGAIPQTLGSARDLKNIQQSTDRTADIAADNFIEICIEDGKLEGLVEEGTNKMPLTYFLIKLLSEFRNQEVPQAMQHQQR